MRLKNGDYFFAPPRQFYVRKNHSSKRRKVYSFQGKDKYLLQLMAFALQDLDYIHASSLCSFRTKNRTKIFFEKVLIKDHGRRCYVMKTDIHDFGGSMDMDVLLSIAAPYFEDDPDFFHFLAWLLTRYEFVRQGKTVREKVSIIEGTPIGSFLQNIYLEELDRILQRESILYMRYTDDIAFFTDSYEKAVWALEESRRVSAKLNIEINEDKTQIFAPGEALELLGIEILPDALDIGVNAAEKLCGKLERYRNKMLRRIRRGRCTPEQAMRRMIVFADNLFYGFRWNDHEFNWVVHAFAIITRTDTLKKLDHYAQDCIRITGTGKLGDSKYRIRYKDMCEKGYRNLCHAYYHGYDVKEVE